MWSCPKCNRNFKNTNQVHGCHQLTIEYITIKRSEQINNLYYDLHSKLNFKDFRREVVPPDVIFYKTKSTFLVVKLKTKWIDVEFFLDYYMDQPIVKKYLQTSKKRFVYVISIDDPDDINCELLEWINYSYQLISN